VIGVMPRTFKEPANVASAWRVFPTEGGENLATSGRFWSVIGRLKVGLTPATVQPELATIAARFAQNGCRVLRRMGLYDRAAPGGTGGNYRDGLLLVIGAALLVLLSPAAIRRRTPARPRLGAPASIAVRLAIGASRWAIARDQLVESLVLVVLGARAVWCWAMGPRSSARQPLRRLDSAQRRIGVNTPVLAVTGAVAVLTGLAFGIYPALHATRVDAVDALRDGARGSPVRRRRAFRNALVAGQIALTLVLLVCAGLVVRASPRSCASILAAGRQYAEPRHFPVRGALRYAAKNAPTITARSSSA